MKYTEKQREKDLRVIEYIENHWIDLNNPYADIEKKIVFLEKVCGWKNLRTGSNASRTPFAPIRECSDGKISMTAQSVYDNAKERLIKNPKMGQLELKFRIENE